jgi:hypothetical protein
MIESSSTLKSNGSRNKSNDRSNELVNNGEIYLLTFADEGVNEKKTDNKVEPGMILTTNEGFVYKKPIRPATPHKASIYANKAIILTKYDLENIQPNYQIHTKKTQIKSNKLNTSKSLKDDRSTEKKANEYKSEKDHCTFKPQINKNSQKIVKSLNYPGINKLVNERRPVVISSNLIPVPIEERAIMDSSKIYLNRYNEMKLTQKEMKIFNELIYKKFN